MYHLRDAYSSDDSPTIASGVIAIGVSILFCLGVFLIFNAKTNSQNAKLEQTIAAIQKSQDEGISVAEALSQLTAGTVKAKNGSKASINTSSIQDGLDNLTVKGGSTLQGSVKITNNLAVTGKLNVDGDITQKGVSLGDIYIKNASDDPVSGTKVDVDEVASGTLDVEDAATIGGNLTVSGLATFSEISLDGDLEVSGATVLGDLSVSGDANFDGDITGSGGLAISGDANFDGLITASGDLTVSGLTITATLQVDDLATVGGDFTVGGLTSIADFLATGNGSIEGDLNVIGNLTQNGVGFIQNISSQDTPYVPASGSTPAVLSTAATPQTADIYISGDITAANLVIGQGEVLPADATSMHTAVAYQAETQGSVRVYGDIQSTAGYKIAGAILPICANPTAMNAACTTAVTPTICSPFSPATTCSPGPACSTVPLYTACVPIPSCTPIGPATSCTSPLPRYDDVNLENSQGGLAVTSLLLTTTNAFIDGTLHVTGQTSVDDALHVAGRTSLDNALVVGTQATLNACDINDQAITDADDGDIVGCSLNVGTGNINGGAISGNALELNGGSLTGADDLGATTLTLTGLADVDSLSVTSLGEFGAIHVFASIEADVNIAATGAIVAGDGGTSTTLHADGTVEIGDKITSVGGAPTITASCKLGYMLTIRSLVGGLATADNNDRCVAAPADVPAGHDYAENYASTQTLAAGDVVAIDTNHSEYVVKSNASNKKFVIGVVSTQAGYTIANDVEGYPIALSGRVPVKVTNEGGAIEPGDYLTSASLPGYAKKAQPGDKTIGQAMASFDGTTGTVVVFVNTSGGNIPDQEFVQGTQSTLTGDASFSSLNVSGATTLSGLTVTGTATIANLEVTGTATVVDLQIKGHIVGNDDTRGTATIVHGTKTIHRDFVKPYAKAPVVVASPTSDATLYSVKTTETGFDINMPATAVADTTFNYLVQE